MPTNALAEVQLKRIEKLAAAIRHEGRDRRQLYRYAELGGLLHAAKGGHQLTPQDLCDATGWKTANILKAIWFSNWADRRTLKRLTTPPDKDSPCPFTWRVAVLLNHQEPRRRQQLINQAIRQKLNARQLERVINPVHERPRPKDLRTAPTAAMLLALLSACVRGFQGELEAFAARRDLLERLAQQQPRRVAAIRAAIDGVQADLPHLRALLDGTRRGSRGNGRK